MEWLGMSDVAVVQAAVSVPIGLAAGQVITTVFSSKENPSGINNALYFYAGFSTFAALLTVFLR